MQSNPKTTYQLTRLSWAIIFACMLATAGVLSAVAIAVPIGIACSCDCEDYDFTFVGTGFVADALTFPGTTDVTGILIEAAPFNSVQDCEAVCWFKPECTYFYIAPLASLPLGPFTNLLNVCLFFNTPPAEFVLQTVPTIGPINLNGAIYRRNK